MSHVWQTLRERFAREVRRAWTQRGTWVAGRGPQIAVAVGLALVVLGTAGFVGVLDAVQENDDLATLDRPVLEGLAASRSEILTVVLTVITTITGPSVLPVIVLLGAVAWGVLGKQWWQAVLLAGAMVRSTLVSVTITAVVARPRPPVITALAAGETRRVRPLRPGVSIAHVDVTAGTLGAFVVVDGRTHVLSNYHVLVGSPAASVGDALLQPGPADGGRMPQDRVGALAAFVALEPGGRGVSELPWAKAGPTRIGLAKASAAMMAA